MEELIIEALKSQVDEKRMKHIEGVVVMAEKLASIHHPDVRAEARLAALFHDLARLWTEERLKAYIRTEKIPLEDGLEEYTQILHGYVAAQIARKDFKIEKAEILEAVRYHTTGKPGMGNLSKIIFLADMLEEGRGFSGIDSLRELALTNLDRAMLASLNHVILYLIKEGKKIHPLVLETRNSFCC